MKKLIVILCAIFLVAGCSAPQQQQNKETGGSGPAEYEKPKRY
jgi:uncharacterized lipoprotein YajG